MCWTAAIIKTSMLLVPPVELATCRNCTSVTRQELQELELLEETELFLKDRSLRNEYRREQDMMEELDVCVSGGGA